MINKLLQLIAPHYCYGCGKVGMTLCDNCKYDIADDSYSACVVCELPASSGICADCRTTYERAWCVGDRTGSLEKLINAFKFERVADAASALASLLDQHLPVLPGNVVLIPVPTVQSHIRQRGYDHTLLISKRLAALRNLKLQCVLARSGSAVQRGSSKKQRFKQASTTFVCTAGLDPEATYLLIDDVITTNATVRFAAAELRKAGATSVWVAVLARQALDKKA